MTNENHKKEGDSNEDIKPGNQEKALQTEHPISERDEVKKAESRTQDLQRNATKADDKKED